MLKFKENPYYYPEKCGLEIFDQIDTAGSYEFDMFVIWKKLDDDSLWWDTDSGCSCPSPFDDHGHDLKPIDEENFFGFDQALKNHYNLSKADYLNMKERVEKHLKIKL